MGSTPMIVAAIMAVLLCDCLRITLFPFNVWKKYDLWAVSEKKGCMYNICEVT